MENKTGVFIIDSIPHSPRARNMPKQGKPTNVATLLNRAKLEYLSSIVFHTVLVAKKYVSRTVWNTIDDRYSIWRTKLEYLSSIVFHTVLVARNMPKQGKPTNVATLLNRAKLEYLASIVFHTVLVAKKYVSRTVWNTIDDRYSIRRTKLEYLSSIVFHTVQVAREYAKTSKTNKCGYIA